MAFSADELRVLRGALAVALQHASDPETSADARAGRRHPRAGVRRPRRDDGRGGRRRGTAERLPARRPRPVPPGAARRRRRLPRHGSRTPWPPATCRVPTTWPRCARWPRTPSGELEHARRAALLRRCEQLAERAVRARMLLIAGGRRMPAVRPGRRPRRRRPPGRARRPGEEAGRQAAPSRHRSPASRPRSPRRSPPAARCPRPARSSRRAAGTGPSQVALFGQASARRASPGPGRRAPAPGAALG